MYTFIDKNGLSVDLYFNTQAYVVKPKHILVIIKKNGRYLCTGHKKRGIEFPGGKAEGEETLLQAAKREVLEETGVEMTAAKEIGYYVVHDEPAFSKVIFFSTEAEESHENFEFETLGREWLTEEEIFTSKNLSFYMEDEGMKYIMQEVKKLD